MEKRKSDGIRKSKTNTKKTRKARRGGGRWEKRGAH